MPRLGRLQSRPCKAAWLMQKLELHPQVRLLYLQLLCKELGQAYAGVEGMKAVLKALNDQVMPVVILTLMPVVHSVSQRSFLLSMHVVHFVS